VSQMWSRCKIFSQSEQRRQTAEDFLSQGWPFARRLGIYIKTTKKDYVFLEWHPKNRFQGKSDQ
jgi:hypothetical protein